MFWDQNSCCISSHGSPPTGGKIANNDYLNGGRANVQVWYKP